MKSLEGKDKVLSELKTALREKKYLINLDQDDLSKKCEIIQKWYNDIQIECNLNHSKMKYLKENLKKLNSRQKNHKAINPGLFEYQVDHITFPINKVIILESDRVFDKYSF